MPNQTLDLEKIYQENPLEYHKLILQDTLNNISISEDKKLTSPEDATELRLQALEDFKLRILEEEGYDLSEYDDEEDNDENYSNDMDLATFASNSAVGSALVGLIEDEYETPEDGIEALNLATGYDTDTILGILSGEFVPDQSLIDDMVQVFDMTEDEYYGLHYLASEVRQDDIFGLGEIDQDEEDDSDDEEEYDEEDEEDNQQYSRLEELENQLANFQLQKELNNEIYKIINEAEDLVNSGHLMPVEFNALFGELPDCVDDDRVALFSSSCESNGIDLETQLYSLRHYLKVAETRGSLNMFGRIVDNDATFSNPNGGKQNKELEKTARHTAHHLLNSGMLKIPE